MISTRSWLLSAMIALLVFVSLLLLQEHQPAVTGELPEIVKRIQASTVVVGTYTEDGKPKSQGSGFFVSPTGQIITNRHVLEGASKSEIKTAQGKIYPVTHILAEDKQADLVLACVDIGTASVQPLKLSDSLPQIGQRVFVVTGPVQRKSTILYATSTVYAIQDTPFSGRIIQLSIPLFPGSSGSPLVDMKGQVIGIATFSVGEEQHRDFAISSQRATKLKPGKPITFAEWDKLTRNKDLVSAEMDYRKGRAYLEKQDYKKAFRFFEKAVRKNPDYGEAWYYIGLCSYELGRYTDAVTAFKEALHSDPITYLMPEVHSNLGSAYIKLGSYSEAIEVFKQAIRLKPDTVNAHYGLGLAYGRLGRHTEEIAAYKQAISIDPDYAEAYCNLGTVYIKLSRDAEAIAAFKQAVRIKPDFALAHYNLGVIYDKLDRLNEAVAALEQAVRIEPDFALAHYNLGVVYGKLGRDTDEIKAYKKATRFKSDFAQAYSNLGLAYSKLDRDAEAIRALKKAVHVKPDFAMAHYNLGVIYNKFGRHTEAIRALKQAIRIEPDDAQSHFNLGVVYGKLGRETDGIEAYKQAIRLKPDFVEAHYNLGLAYAKLERFDEAIAAFKQAIDLKPDWAEAHYNLGLAYFAISDKDSAQLQYEILKTLDKKMANKLFKSIHE